MKNNITKKDFSNSNQFVSSFIRLIKQLKKYRYKVIIAILMAVISVILTIFCPQKMGDLTEEIKKGLTLNNEKLTILTTDIQNNYDKNIFEDINIDGEKISIEDQEKFISIINESKTENKDIYKVYELFPNSVKEAIKPSMNLKAIKNIIVLLIVLYSISSLFNYLQDVILATVSNDYAKKLRSVITDKINSLPLSYFDKNAYGDILSKITNDVDTISSSFSQSLSLFVGSIVMLIGIVFMMLKTNVLMALAAMLSSIVGFALMSLIMAKSQKYFEYKQKEFGKLNGYIEEAYSGFTNIKSYNAEKEFIDNFNRYNQNVCKSNQKSQFLGGLMHPLMNFVGNLGYVSVCILGAILTSKNIITFGTIIAFISYARLFSHPLSQIAQTLSSFQLAVAASDRVFELLDAEELANEDGITKFLRPKKVQGEIEFKNVNFSYTNDKEIIKNFSAKCKAGSKIAIVGPTGAGKTTLVNLLMKFYDVIDGDILIDGVSIKELTRSNIHDLFTMVLQDTWLFNGTIKENIIYNRHNISDKKVKEVCEIVGIDHFIKTLTDGYDTLVTDEEQISIGQKQLITIARAMLSNTPFIILDEATSNVDTRTEELVAKAMDKLMENKTSFIIAHRLSTIKNADLILVMKDGNIIEKGKHQELLNKDGFYSKLYNSQFNE